MTQLSQIWKEVSRKLGATWHFSRKKWAIFGQIKARGAGCAGVRGVMTESERIVLGEEGEGDSDDSESIIFIHLPNESRRFQPSTFPTRLKFFIFADTS